jgi:hypothetical protein
VSSVRNLQNRNLQNRNLQREREGKPERERERQGKREREREGKPERERERQGKRERERERERERTYLVELFTHDTPRSFLTRNIVPESIRLAERRSLLGTSISQDLWENILWAVRL